MAVQPSATFSEFWHCQWKLALGTLIFIVLDYPPLHYLDENHFRSYTFSLTGSLWTIFLTDKRKTNKCGRTQSHDLIIKGHTRNRKCIPLRGGSGSDGADMQIQERSWMSFGWGSWVWVELSFLKSILKAFFFSVVKLRFVFRIWLAGETAAPDWLCLPPMLDSTWLGTESWLVSWNQTMNSAISAATSTQKAL